ncbi:MAG: hypothetical protein H5U02_10410 [Clostridia bacterium]|nr:hypothetical protein [Clostridia bacterium]
MAIDPYQKKTQVEVKKKECGGRVYVLVVSEERSQGPSHKGNSRKTPSL